MQDMEFTIETGKTLYPSKLETERDLHKLGIRVAVDLVHERFNK